MWQLLGVLCESSVVPAGAEQPLLPVPVPPSRVPAAPGSAGDAPGPGLQDRPSGHVWRRREEPEPLRGMKPVSRADAQRYSPSVPGEH